MPKNAAKSFTSGKIYYIMNEKVKLGDSEIALSQRKMYFDSVLNRNAVFFCAHCQTANGFVQSNGPRFPMPRYGGAEFYLRKLVEYKGETPHEEGNTKKRYAYMLYWPSRWFAPSL